MLAWFDITVYSSWRDPYTGKIEERGKIEIASEMFTKFYSFVSSCGFTNKKTHQGLPVTPVWERLLRLAETALSCQAGYTAPPCG